ncbi:hypothetical protein [Streptomyces sp. 35G-GA-8]|uniref:hypothetical protein n=1 Tax=Streptomyces sp. 35G-GA-8 TaxID=2939434 RepID=UPI0035B17C06
MGAGDPSHAVPARLTGRRYGRDEVETAFRWWEGQGRPGFDRFGLTVDADEERVWLDTPDALVVP